jgi:hypothetical protein
VLTPWSQLRDDSQQRIVAYCWRLESQQITYLRYCVHFMFNFLFPAHFLFKVYFEFWFTQIIMVKLFDISKLRYYVAYHSSKKFSKMSKNINLIDFYQFGNFWMSHHMITQSFENSQKSVFGRNLRTHMDMKGWFARWQRGAWLSDPKGS